MEYRLTVIKKTNKALNNLIGFNDALGQHVFQVNKQRVQSQKPIIKYTNLIISEIELKHKASNQLTT